VLLVGVMQMALHGIIGMTVMRNQLVRNWPSAARGGSPASALRPVARMEHMIALGCRTFIAYGGAGTLNGSIAVGNIVVPDSAVRDEGMSLYYLKPLREVAPTPRVAGCDRGSAARKSSRVRERQDLNHGRGLSRDAGADEPAPA
jgi:uridine phosphorylase